MIAAIAAQSASSAGLNPDALSFTAVLSLVRSHDTADSCCKHCGKRPASAHDPLAPLTTAILATRATGQAENAPPAGPPQNDGTGVPKKRPTQ